MKKLFLLFGCLMTTAVCHGTITVSTTTAVANSGNGTLAWPTTFGASDTCAVLNCQGYGISLTSASINFTSFFNELPNISTDVPDGSKTYQLTFANPPSGATTITATFSGANNGNCELISLAGSSPCTVDISTETSGNGTVVGSTFTTTVANDLLIDNIAVNNSAVGNLGIGQTLIFISTNTNQGDTGGSSYKSVTTAGSYFMTWNVNSNKYAQSVVAIEPASTVVIPVGHHVLQE